MKIERTAEARGGDYYVSVRAVSSKAGEVTATKDIVKLSESQFKRYEVWLTRSSEPIRKYLADLKKVQREILEFGREQ